MLHRPRTSVQALNDILHGIKISAFQLHDELVVYIRLFVYKDAEEKMLGSLLKTIKEVLELRYLTDERPIPFSQYLVPVQVGASHIVAAANELLTIMQEVTRTIPIEKRHIDCDRLIDDIEIEAWIDQLFLLTTRFDEVMEEVNVGFIPGKL